MITINNEEQFVNWIENHSLDVISKYEEYKQIKDRENKNYSVHQTQAIIKKGNRKTLELIASGELQINNEGKVLGTSINEYLRKLKKPEDLDITRNMHKSNSNNSAFEMSM